MNAAPCAAPGRLRGLAPVFATDARVLVLGSMPGAASLAAGEYYAHARNAFWPIMGALFAAGPELPYARRLARLQECAVALWDVIARCTRPGSLDSAIVPASVTPNDVPALVRACPDLRHVFFNGAAAEHAFRRHLPALAACGLELTRLPSTSPAHAARSFAAKLAAWQAVRIAAQASAGACTA